MSTYNSIAWLPLAAGLTGLGLVLSYLAGRKRGLRSFLRGAAWSLLPIAAYLTGSIEMFWKIGSAIGTFATSFVFSPKVWSGIAVAGLAAIMFIGSGGRRRRRAKVDRASGADGAAAAGSAPAATRGPGKAVAATGTTPAGLPATRSEPAPARRKAKGDGMDDDMKEIEDILRQRGIK
jgi:hypothetical protein